MVLIASTFTATMARKTDCPLRTHASTVSLRISLSTVQPSADHELTQTTQNLIFLNTIATTSYVRRS